jgi:hypothetical protein
VRREGRRRGKIVDEVTRDDSAVGRTEVGSSHKTNGIMRPVTFEMPASLACSNIEEWMEGVVEEEMPTWAK